MEAEARALGVPTQVTELFRANSKSDQLRKLRDFRLTGIELFTTIFNHDQIGFRIAAGVARGRSAGVAVVAEWW